MKSIFIKIVGVASVIAGLSACGSGGDQPSAAGAAVPAKKPVSARLTSCGLEVKVAAPPERAVALEQNATEIMLTLGLANRMAGTSYQTDPVLPALADDYAKVPLLAKQYPSRESVLAREPDFLYSTRASAFSAEAAGERRQWAAAGVPAYLSADDCEDTSQSRSTLSYDAVFAEIKDIAEVFDVEKRGEAVVDGLRGRLDRAVAGSPTGPNRKLMWYYSGTHTPYVAGKGGLPSTISQLLHQENTFDDVNQKWFAGSWEKIAERNPDVIVLADLTRGGDGDSAGAKERFLRSNPVTSKLDAVRNNRFIVVSGASLDPSVRSVDAAEAASSGLKKLYG